MDYRVALFTDLSSAGKSSLSVMMPALEMLGVEACPVSTGLLSTQSDGFLDPFVHDGTPQFCSILDEWQRIGLSFDGIYSGWFFSREEIERTALFVKRHPSAFFLCDPVLGDGGELYPAMDGSLVPAISSLASLADLVTPNPTEAALLLSVDHFSPPLLSRLPGRRHMVTGYGEEGESGIVLDGDFVPYERYPASLPGTGDLFAAILLALIVKGEEMRKATEKSATLVFLAIERTMRERKWGVSVASIRRELAVL